MDPVKELNEIADWLDVNSSMKAGDIFDDAMYDEKIVQRLRALAKHLEAQDPPPNNTPECCYDCGR